MASTSAEIVPYSSTPIPQWPYGVFLSFRGEDTRSNFSDHLYTSLDGRGIHTFRDDPSLRSGEEIAPELLKAIEKSRFSIVVFSKNYANSRWCLDELAKIMDCREQKGQTVIPVFYHVDPSDVRNQRGSFGEAFSKYEEDTEEKKEKVRRWRTALTEAAKLSGHHVKENEGYESEVIKKILKHVCDTLNHGFLHIDKNIVGMDEHLKEVISQLCISLNDVVRIVGIYGCGGIGKTTIAKVVYNRFSHQYEGTSFLENIRETSIDSHGLVKLQKQLLDDILVGDNNNINNVDQGKIMIQNKLKFKKVLIVLDDVDHESQLESLVGSKQWFGQGSRMVITTRDKHWLDVCDADDSYNVNLLNSEEAIELFSWNAFRQSHPKQEYKCFLEDVVHYAKGLPLALKILGTLLHCKNELYWKDALAKLKTIPNLKIQKILRISYDGLDDLQKSLFLDIACFFRGENRDFVSRILDGCGSHATSGIEDLCDRSLISVSNNNKIDMHDLIQEMGRDIVREKDREDPSQWSRLWNSKDISCAFTKEKGMENIVGIFLDLSDSGKMQINSNAWIAMKRLRLLKFYSRYWWVGKEVLLPKDFEFSSHELRYLHWEGFFLQSLPSNFYGENLVEIHLKDSNIRKLWEGDKSFPKLKVLNLSGSRELIETPNFSKMQKLEKLSLEYCRSLEKLDPSIEELNELVWLKLIGCTNLRSLPSGIGRLGSLKLLDLSFCENWRTLPSSICMLRSLEKLDLCACSSLEAFPEITEDLNHLTDLDLNSCQNLRSLPSSIWRLRSLETLELNYTSLEAFPEIMEDLNHLTYLGLANCRNLRSLPSSICKLRLLEKLILVRCSSLEVFPEITGDLNHLTDLRLDWCKNLRSLPSSLCRLRSLKILTLDYCLRLEAFPEIVEDLNHLIVLSLKCCKNLRSLPTSICRLRSLENLDLNYCSKLEAFPAIMEDMECLKWLDLSETGVKELPSSIEHLNHLTYLDLSCCRCLRSLPSSIYRLRSLETLKLRECSSLKAFPEIMEDAKCSRLDFSETGPFKTGEISKNPWDLKCLDLSFCYSLKGAIPTDISQFCKLQSINIRHCKVGAIPELPSSLMEIDAHECTGLESLLRPSSAQWISLLKWFKSVTDQGHVGREVQKRSLIRQMTIPPIGRSGIPGWVSHQQMGSEVKIELPMNWYEDIRFFGFVLCCLLPDGIGKLRCALTFHHNSNEDFRDEVWSSPSKELGITARVWVCFYPKVNIPDKYHSIQFTHVKASFWWERRSGPQQLREQELERERKWQWDRLLDGIWDWDWEELEGETIKRCGVNLVSFRNQQENNIQLEFVGTQDEDEDEDDDEIMLLDSFPKKFGSLGSTAGNSTVKRSRDSPEQNQVEEAHQKKIVKNTDLNL